MGRPSIFSKDYEKKMKRRKIRNIILIIIAVLTLGGFFARKYISKNITFLSFKSFFSEKQDGELDKGETNKGKEINSDKEDESEKDKEEKKEEQSKEEVEENKEEISDKDLTLDLGSGKEIKVIYTENQGGREYKVIDPLKSKISFDISQNKDFIVIIDEETQNIYTINKEGALEDITLKEYVTSDNRNTFYKDNTLKEKPDYIWHSTPRIVDNNNLAYISKLPWFNKDDYYIWMVDLTSKSHKMVYNISGKNISFGKLEEKGLEINMDGSLKYLKPDGSLVD
ncbi:hypothetical protein [Clostridium hydrogeniformans]|uniref:hypothetical protein n=1 Tax=Clostridium hydrogeniformans TaxID=349933 RepID=UPI00048673EC|nr:hypothetical protein [Clostridium hydrogeniformans]